ncbi:MAG: hypothetical protein R6U40_05290 [Desulfobacterales bacterium]
MASIKLDKELISDADLGQLEELVKVAKSIKVKDDVKFQQLKNKSLPKLFSHNNKVI